MIMAVVRVYLVHFDECTHSMTADRQTKQLIWTSSQSLAVIHYYWAPQYTECGMDILDSSPNPERQME